MNQENHSALTVQPESYASNFGSIIKTEGLFYAATNDGESIVPIPNNVAQIITVALKIQDKIDREKHPRIFRALSVLNCRKAALVASGALSLDDAIDTESEDLSGIDDLLKDVDRLLDSGFEFHSLSDSSKFRTLLDEYEETFPCIVHIFESDRAIIGAIDTDVAKKIHRVHSFLVLGDDDGEYVCFQKTGPGASEPFVICELEEITSAFQHTSRIQHFIFGPYKS